MCQKCNYKYTRMTSLETQVCLSMCDLFVTTRNQRVNFERISTALASLCMSIHMLSSVGLPSGHSQKQDTLNSTLLIVGKNPG